MKTLYIYLCCLVAIEAIDTMTLVGMEVGKKEALFNAIQGGDLQKMEKNLNANPKLLNARLKNGQGPLHVAVTAGYPKLTEKLCSYQEIKINAQDKLLRTPLHLATARGNVAAIILLCQLPKIEINILDAEGSTPLLNAVKSGSLEAIGAICKHPKVDVLMGDLDGSRPIHVAAAYDLGAAIDFFITKKKVPVDIKNDFDYTPLHTASFFGNSDAIKTLVKNGADLKAITKKTRYSPPLSPLGFSLVTGHYAAAALLIEHGAQMTTELWNTIRKKGKMKFKEVAEVLITDAYAERNNFTSDDEWGEFYKSIYNATKNKLDKKPLTGACKAYVQLITAGMGEQKTTFSEKEIASGKKYFKQFPPKS